MIGETVNGHTYWYSYTHTVKGVRVTIYEDDIATEDHEAASADAAYQKFQDFIIERKKNVDA